MLNPLHVNIVAIADGSDMLQHIDEHMLVALLTKNNSGHCMVSQRSVVDLSMMCTKDQLGQFLDESGRNDEETNAEDEREVAMLNSPSLVMSAREQRHNT